MRVEEAGKQAVVPTQGFAEKAKQVAKATADAAQTKMLQTQFEQSLNRLGRAAYENRTKLQLPKDQSDAIGDLQNRMAQLETEVRTVSKSKIALSLISSPAVLALLFVCCFPLGLFLLWKNETYTKKTKMIWTGAFAGFLIIGTILQQMQVAEMNKSLKEANALWDSGKTNDAVEKYRGVIDHHWGNLASSERQTLVRRVVEFDVEHNNETAAKAMIKRAVGYNVVLTFENSKAQGLYEVVQAEAKPKKSSSEGKGSTSSRLTALELIKAFDNQASGETTYSGKQIEVEGPVVNVDQGHSSESMFAKKQFFVTIGGALGPRGYNTWIEGFFSDKKKASSIRPGSTVVIRGKVTGRNGPTVTMTDCEVISD